MTEQIGTNLTGLGIFYKARVPTNPSSAPVLRTLIKPDLSVTTPGSALTAHPSAGIYGGTLVTALQNDQFGVYVAELFTSDGTMDNQVVQIPFEVRPVPATAGAQVTLASSIAADLTVTIQQGDAIVAGSPNQIQWVDQSNIWSALNITAVTLFLSTQPGYANEVDFPATYNAGNKTITLNNLTAIQTGNFKLTTYNYRLRATINPTSSGPVTLVTGKFIVARAA